MWLLNKILFNDFNGKYSFSILVKKSDFTILVRNYTFRLFPKNQNNEFGEKILFSSFGWKKHTFAVLVAKFGFFFCGFSRNMIVRFQQRNIILWFWQKNFDSTSLVGKPNCMVSARNSIFNFRGKKLILRFLEKKWFCSFGRKTQFYDYSSVKKSQFVLLVETINLTILRRKTWF